MTELLLIRHAATDAVGRRLTGRAPAVDLNDDGRAQAAGLVFRLTNVGIDAIFTSPLRRAVQTAEPLAATRNLSLGTLPALNELDYGSWQDMSIEALGEDARWQRYNRSRSLCRIPGGELLAEAQLRMVQAIEQLHREHEGARLVLVSHGDTIRALLLFLLGMPLDFVTRIQVAPASVSIVRIDHDDAATVLCVNHTGDLAGVSQ